MNNIMEVSTAACKVVAPTSREALRLLRESMGPDAIVLSNRVTANGIEILATVEEQLAQMMAASTRPAAAVAPTHARAETARPADDDSILREIHSMRSMMQEQLADLSWHEKQGRDPLRRQLLRSLLGAGFSARLARDVLTTLPADQDFAGGMAYVKAELARQLPMLEDEAAMMDEGGVYALMGPTGVGKTTTTAKLAARCAMRFGSGKLALVTTDGYRIGAYEQLRIYGQILGVTVYAVKDAADLERALVELADKHMVLIDTVGMSQRDRAVSDQIAMLRGSSRPVKRLLLLNASSHGDTLNEVVQSYRHGVQAPDSTDLAGCIFTKVDEATHPGAQIDTAIRHQLPVHYVSNGQKVPEDLMTVDRDALIEQVFQARSRSSLFIPGEADLATTVATLHQVADQNADAAIWRLFSHGQQVIEALTDQARGQASNSNAHSNDRISFQ
ncbi:MAG: flagellar biosynthesis protein FlhF [Comamonadaceae bacterium]